jgi:hypothetical protein
LSVGWAWSSTNPLRGPRNVAGGSEGGFDLRKLVRGDDPIKADAPGRGKDPAFIEAADLPGSATEVGGDRAQGHMLGHEVVSGVSIK